LTILKAGAILKFMLKYLEVDATLRALAEPTRRAIVDRLSEGPTSVSEIARPFDMSLAAVVQHLQVLEEAGIIRSEKLGRVRTCTLQPDGLRPLSRWLSDRRNLMERKFDRLGELFAAEAGKETRENANDAGT
jgi:DNA-binding transcriptional ArsR family regulator